MISAPSGKIITRFFTARRRSRHSPERAWLSASDDFCPKRQNHHALLYGSPAEPAFA